MAQLEDSSEVHSLIDTFLKNPAGLFKFEILVCGRTGVGKSSLINSLMGRVLCPVGDPGDVEDYFKPVTKEVIEYSFKHDGLIITIWDSPGLQDGTENEAEYLQDMYDKCQNVDLVIYCVEMTLSRWTLSEMKATQLLTEKFGISFWEKAVIVLTKANAVTILPKHRGDERKYHSRIYDNIRNRFQKQLEEEKVSHDVTITIPLVCAGLCDENDPENPERYLWYVSDSDSDTDPTEKINFIPELWETCLVRLPTEIAYFKFMKATTDNMNRLESTIKEQMSVHTKELMQERDQLKQELEEVKQIILSDPRSKAATDKYKSELDRTPEAPKPSPGFKLKFKKGLRKVVKTVEESKTKEYIVRSMKFGWKEGMKSASDNSRIPGIALVTASVASIIGGGIGLGMGMFSDIMNAVTSSKEP